jgi:hypothetical protein
MAKRPAKKAEKQLDLPVPAPAPPPTTTKILPIQLRVGDRLKDETGEWEVAGRPFTTAGGKNAHVRLQRVNQSGVTDIRTWGAHEKVSVKRATAQEGKR